MATRIYLLSPLQTIKIKQNGLNYYRLIKAVTFTASLPFSFGKPRYNIPS